MGAHHSDNRHHTVSYRCDKRLAVRRTYFWFSIWLVEAPYAKRCNEKVTFFSPFSFHFVDYEHVMSLFCSAVSLC